jgi:hypothetical protein
MIASPVTFCLDSDSINEQRVPAHLREDVLYARFASDCGQHFRRGNENVKEDHFKQLFEEIEWIRRVVAEDPSNSYWEVYDGFEEFVGICLLLEVPEAPPQTDDAADLTNMRYG